MFKNKFGKKNNKGYEDIQYTCKIRFLDDSEPITVTFQKHTKGQWLLDHVCKELNLVEKAYFGLRYVDNEKQRHHKQSPFSHSPSSIVDNWHWLDPLKSVYRQLKHVNQMVLCFRVKFYPTDPMKLKEEITRYFLFLQLRRDLHHGRLLCSPQDANLLAAYIIQSEVGDYDPQDHPPGYVSQFKMLPKQTQKQEEKIAEIHKGLSLSGCQVPSEAEANFLRKACSLDTYGVDPHPVKEQKGNQMYLGVTHLGIVTFQGNKRTHLFKWPQINKIVFEGKMFIVHVTISEGEPHSPNFKRKKHACGFKCPTFNACKHLWKCAVEQQYFFTLGQATEAPKVTSSGGWFTRGSKFRFSGRCQKEVYQESASILRDPPLFERSLSNPQFVRSFNKLRSVSMPNKFRDRSQEIDEVEVNNQLSTATLPLMTRSHEMHEISSFENVENSIPEEHAVTLSEVPYNPLDSPQSEDLPGFPEEEKPRSGDLDAQIQELQNELDRCRLSTTPVVDTNHIGAPELPDEEAMEEELRATVAPQNEGLLKSSAPTAAQKEPNGMKNMGMEFEEPQKRSVPVCRLVALSVAFLIALLLLLMILILETDAQVPVLRDIRNFPSIQLFKRHHYNPFKAGMAQKVGGWFKA